MSLEFHTRKANLADARLVSTPARDLLEGEILTRVERFAFTANNVTYGVVGERIGYWNFFSVEGEWGIIPVWGVARVEASRATDISVGERIYGYLPMAERLILQPGRVRTERLIDQAAHRQGLPAVYNAYARLGGEPVGVPAPHATEEERMLLFPLYATSFCLYDFLLDNRWFGAERVVVVSASSKTAVGLAAALSEDPQAPPVTGITSAGNVDFVEQLGHYDHVIPYDALTSIDPNTPTVIVDMSGNGSVLAQLHSHLGAAMVYCSNVGATHWDEMGPQPGFIRERSAMFFAPAHIQKRNAEWGPGAFEARALEFWKRGAVQSRSWLKIERVPGLKALMPVFHEMRLGRMAPDRGVIVDV